MNRRRFLQASTSAATLAPLRSQSVMQRAGQSVNRELAGVTLRELRAQYRKDLFTDFLPFMEKYVIDHELGGFMCNADHLGNRVNQNKLSWFEGRGTWVYSFLYNNLARDKKYLEVARRSIEFTLKAKPAGEGLWPKELTREGKPVTSAEGEIYGDLFIAEGLAEYSKATGERHYWAMAHEILFKCLEIYERPDYRPTHWSNLFRTGGQIVSRCADSGSLDGRDSTCHPNARDACRCSA